MCKYSPNLVGVFVNHVRGDDVTSTKGGKSTELFSQRST